MSRPRIAYVIGNHTDGRDLRYCAGFTQSDVTFVGRTGPEDEKTITNAKNDLRVIAPQYRKVIPDRFNRMSNGRYDITAWIYLADLERHILDCDVIYTPGTYTSTSAQCARIAKKLRKPLVIFEWETIPHHLTAWLPPYAFWTRSVIRNASLFVALTDRAHLYLQSLGVPKEKRVTVYPSVEMEKFSPRSSTTMDPSAPTRILFVGRLTPEKGLGDLLAAFPKVIQQCPNTELWICGRGSMEEEVREAAKKLPIIWKGFVHHQDLPRIFQSVDLFCLPSRDRIWHRIRIWEEQFGFVFVEAMAAGLPIVTTNNGAIPEVVGEQNTIIRQGSIDDLVSSLVQWIQDPVSRQRVGKANRERALTVFSDAQQIPMLEQTILSVFKKNP